MVRIGVDFGGTKIEAAALGADVRFVARVRAANPGAYEPAIETVRHLVAEAERQAQVSGAPVGVGLPGSLSAVTGRVRNANSVWLNDRPFDKDLEAALGRPIRVHNDANCFALSEATDGAAAGATVVSGAILGTGCGGGNWAGCTFVASIRLGLTSSISIVMRPGWPWKSMAIVMTWRIGRREMNGAMRGWRARA